MKLSIKGSQSYNKIEHICQYFTDPTISVTGDIDISKMNELVLSEFWPEAIAPTQIVKDDRDIKDRANSIIKYYVGDLKDKSFLDFGCGNGSCVRAAESVAKVSVGYDVVRHPSWNASCTDDIDAIKAHAPYNVILLYDVFDHIPEEKVDSAFNLLRSLCNEKTVLKMRCHPFTSIHGGHLYQKLNKAYAHLFLDDKTAEPYVDGFTRRIQRPLFTYRDTVQKNGFIIKRDEIIKSAISDNVASIIKSPEIVKHIYHLFNADPAWVDYILPIEFVDYTIGLG